MQSSIRHAHPRADQMELLLRGELSRGEAVPVVRHLLTGCTECLEVTRRLWVLGEKPRGRGRRGRR